MLNTKIEKEEIKKWLKGISALNMALSMVGEEGVEISPDAEYVIGQLIDIISNVAA